MRTGHVRTDHVRTGDIRTGNVHAGRGSATTVPVRGRDLPTVGPGRTGHDRNTGPPLRLARLDRRHLPPGDLGTVDRPPARLGTSRPATVDRPYRIPGLETVAVIGGDSGLVVGDAVRRPGDRAETVGTDRRRGAPDRLRHVGALLVGAGYLGAPTDGPVVTPCGGPADVTVVTPRAPSTGGADRPEVVVLPRLRSAVATCGFLPVLVTAEFDGARPFVGALDGALVVPEFVGADLDGAPATATAVVPAGRAGVVPAVAGGFPAVLLVPAGGRLVPAFGSLLPGCALAAAAAAGRRLVPPVVVPGRGTVAVAVPVPVVPAVAAVRLVPAHPLVTPVPVVTPVIAPVPTVARVITPVVTPIPIVAGVTLIPAVTTVPQIIPATEIVAGIVTEVVPAARLVPVPAGPVPAVITVVVTPSTGRALVTVRAAPRRVAAPQVRTRRRVLDGEVGFVEVDAEFGPVEVDVVEVVADQVVDVGVDRHEVGLVEPAGPLGVEGGLLLAPGRELVLGEGGTAARRNDGVRNLTLGVVLLLNDRGTRHERVLAVLVLPVFVVLKAHDEAPNRLGKNPPPRRRMEATVLTLYHLRTPVPAPRAPDQRLPRGGCGRLTTDLRSAPPHCGPPSPAARTLHGPGSHRRRSSPVRRDHRGIRPAGPPGSTV
ncbi:hypothetical protein [Actinoplanes couchii]|uniref:hypothetical protein n=1 Tax=Actinoplanes couchii TaxID=403638 RepID=UPI001940DCE1|nr:hypothetical protein [Actinoplanes couchii]MDR6316660.1 hypothetical protein [Actinoplanes couchii]